MPEITEQELANLRTAQKVLNELMGPKTRDRAEALIKEHHPDIRTTADDLRPHLEPIDKLRKDFDEFKSKFEADTQDKQFRAAYERVKKDGNFTDEGMEKILTIMKERTIPDIEAAAALYMKHVPKPQEPSTFAPSSWGFGAKTEDPDLKLLFSDEDAFAEKEAMRVFQGANQVRTG